MSGVSLEKDLRDLLGDQQVITNNKHNEHYRQGWRSGEGDAAAVVFPKRLIDLWHLLKVCVNHNCIVIMQAANTGLTEGSTPSGNDYDRPVVVINTLAMNHIQVLGDGEQVISFPGATLHALEKTLKPYGRAPHSVIGSSCLGASIVGGIANNSGGALVKRGPAYTELSLFAQVNKKGELQLVNHLGIELGNTPESIIENLESGNFERCTSTTDKKASANDYETVIRDIDSPTPSRFNADPSRLYEASGCAGKLAVFAVRLDTFAVANQEKTFYIGTNSADTLTHLRRHILSKFTYLPEVAEYMHRDMFDISRKYGKDTFLAVKHLGTDTLPKMFALKGRIDAFLNKLSFVPNHLTDKLMQLASCAFPDHLPTKLGCYRDTYEHHLILKMSDEGIGEAEAFLREYFSNTERGNYFECNDLEAQSAFLNRFAAAGAAMRYQILQGNRVGDILALDIALRRNEMNWVESLPEALDKKIDKKLYYGHFLCHVFHQDYILKQGESAKAVKSEMLSLLDERGAKYPAEHNVGHLYEAEPQLKAFYTELDPTNTFNPGVGGMSKFKRNCSCGL